MPPPDVSSDTIILRGEQAKLGPALISVYSKTNNVKTDHMVSVNIKHKNVPDWLHKYIIGKKVANIMHMTQDLPKVRVDFIDESIRVEGLLEEIYEVCKKLKEMIYNFENKLLMKESK
ncbi:vigilin [Nephila pilipes]|uniref:Vigilin n=1 Tax=Nephila pilipes TaxID=299642 RepID=A0A8X6QB41_NEPPI|nr:vigilin [Nephila pilipes]